MSMTRTTATCGILAMVLAAGALAAQAASSDPGYSNFLELRVYTTQEGQRDRFLEYFEEHYLESQEVVGMRIWGEFRDLVNPTQFVWMHGYRTMGERQAGLLQFYTSPVWQETGAEVRDMLGERASHVHLLEPVSAREAFPENSRRPVLLSEQPQPDRRGVVVAQLFLVEDGTVSDLIEAVRNSVIPDYVDNGAVSLGLFRSSEEPNNFPALPYIEDEVVVAWFGSFETDAAFESARESAPLGLEPFETLRLAPGERSRLRHLQSQ